MGELTIETVREDLKFLSTLAIGIWYHKARCRQGMIIILIPLISVFIEIAVAVYFSLTNNHLMALLIIMLGGLTWSAWNYHIEPATSESMMTHAKLCDRLMDIFQGLSACECLYHQDKRYWNTQLTQALESIPDYNQALLSLCANAWDYSLSFVNEQIGENYTPVRRYSRYTRLYRYLKSFQHYS